jgi:hypothetical protein
MSTQNTPKITANNSNSNKPFKKPFFHEKPEKRFKTKQELQAYLVDSVSNNKRRSFHMNVKLS